jgi:molybdate transport system ATP-binding protein
LAGLERMSGTLRVGEETWQDDARRIFTPTHERALGYVLQDPGLFAHLSVRANVEYGRKRRARRAAGPLLDVAGGVDLLGIGSLMDRSPAHLSGGERQRVALARALVAGPRLLLMDEPLASLDAARKAEVLPYLERLRDELAIPAIYVSHSIDEVARLARHVVLLEGGRVIASGAAGETLTRLDLPLAKLDDAGVVIDAKVAEHDDGDSLTRLDVGGATLWVGRIDRPAGSTARVRVLARDVSLAREPPGPTSILNVLPGRIEDLSDDGPGRVSVRVAVGANAVPVLARITRKSRDALDLRRGVSVHAMVKSVAIVT